MRTSSIGLLLLVLGLALGGGLGFLLGSGSGPGGSAGSMAGGPELAAGGSVVRAAERTAPGEETGSADLAVASGPESRGGAAPRAVDDARAVAAARSVSGRVDGGAELAASDHDGVIQGTVKDEFGAPVEGATVISRGRARWDEAEVSGSSTDRVGRAWKRPDTLEAELERYAKRRSKERATLRPVETDAEGRFRLEGLEPGSHSLQAYAEGLFFDGTRAKTGTFAALIGSRVGEFRVDVVAAYGTPVEEAMVMVLDSEDDEEAKTWTRESPVVRLGTRSARLRVLSGRVISYQYGKHTAALASPVRLVDLDRDGEGPHVFELAPRDQLRVAVVDPTADGPTMRPWVRVKKAGEEGEPKKLRQRRNGPFVALGLEHGTYEVTAGRSSKEPEVTEVVEVQGGLSEISLELPLLDPSRFLIARCRTAEGKAIPGVSFGYRVKRSGGGSSSGGTSATQRSPGEYWIDSSRIVERIRGDEDAEVWIDARTSQYGNLRKKIELGGEPVNFEFTEPCDLILEVARAGGKLFRVEVKPLQREGPQDGMYSHSGDTKAIGADGRLEYGFLQPGKVRISLYPAAENHWGPPLLSEETSLPSGPYVHTMAAPELHDLVIHAPDMKEGTDVHLSLVDETSGWNHVGSKPLDDTLRARFTEVAPGRYSVMSWNGTTNRTMQVDVPCGEVQFEEMEVRAYVLSAVVSGKLADKAGLVNGDLILSAAGHAASKTTFAERFWLEVGDGATELEIERGGKVMTVTLDAVPVGEQAWTAFGGTIMPSE